MYGTHSLGFSRRWKPQPDSSCRDLSAIRIMFPSELHENKWSVKCCTCHKPCSMLMSMRAIPQRSFGPNATRLGNDLFTPSLLGMACIALHWILFRVSGSNIVTCREYVIDGTYVLKWKMKVSILLRLNIDNLAIRILVGLVQKKLTLFLVVNHLELGVLQEYIMPPTPQVLELLYNWECFQRWVQ